MFIKLLHLAFNAQRPNFLKIELEGSTVTVHTK